MPRLATLLILLLIATASARGDSITIGSKTFTESRLLAEIMAQAIENETDLSVERRLGLGGTMICFSALQEGALDLYAEYTGTGLVAILDESPTGDPMRTMHHVRRVFADRYDLTWLAPFGFNNTYALAMRAEQAAALDVTRISDLHEHPDLRVGFGHEFINRPDGWPGLSAAYAYALDLPDIRAIEHGLAYPAIASGQLDLIDVYNTDGKLAELDLRVLRDDRSFFPAYHAAPLVRSETLTRHPEIGPVLDDLAFTLPDDRMRQLNAEVESRGRDVADVAAEFLRLRDAGQLDDIDARAGTVRAASTAPRARGFFPLMASRASVTAHLTWEHLQLTGLSVLLACAVGIPLGIGIIHWSRLAPPVLWATGVIQTVPSLALLAFMIPLLGLGFPAAIAALFLYALLPIVRNTYTGIKGVDADLLEAACGMGLTRWQVLRIVQFPLATTTIMAGVRTSTVIGVGVATLAAFVGAGGLGEPILTGLQLNDVNLILTGALPAALLAIAVDLSLGGLERLVAPRGV